LQLATTVSGLRQIVMSASEHDETCVCPEGQVVPVSLQKQLPG
jgi:hypothetical protein